MTGVENKTEKKKGFVTKKFVQEAVIAIVAAIVGAVVSWYLTNGSIEDGIVKSLSTRFEYIDQTMSAEDAIDALAKKNEEQQREIAKKGEELATREAEIKDLKSGMGEMLDGSIESPSLVIEGLEQDSAPGRSLALVDGGHFYSESLVNKLLEGTVSYSAEEKTIYYTEEPSGQASSKVYLRDTSVLYDGMNMKSYGIDNTDELSIGSEKYSYGFALRSWRNSWSGSHYGYALFELKGAYSTLSFDVGRVNNTNLNDAVLKVFLDDEREPSQQIDLSADVGTKHLDIQLDYAQTLKLQVDSDEETEYGFVNLVLSE